MPKFIVDLWLDGYETEEEANAAAKEFIDDQLNFSGSSVQIQEPTPCANCEKLEAEFRSAKNAGCDATCLNYRDGDEEIQRLQKQLEMCKEVLEWYSSDEAHGAGELVWKKTQYVSDGGKRARECLAKLEKE